MRARGSSCAGLLGPALCALLVLAVAVVPSRVRAHGADVIEIASTANGGGSLVALYDFGTPLSPTPSLSAGGYTVYTTIYPSFDSIEADGAGSFVLDDGVPLRLEVVSINGGCPAPPAHECVSLKIDSTLLDAVGESVSLGTTPDIADVHPEWSLTLPDGVTGSFTITLRITTTSGRYAASAPFTVTLGNGPTATPTPTPTPGGTATPTPTAAVAVGTAAELAVPEAGGAGDQLLFYYDARPGFTTFVNLANLGATELAVRLRFYGADLRTALDRDELLPAGGTRTISLDAMVAAGLPRQAGLAVAAAIGDAGSPVVTHALAGNFTIANLQTSSAWGAAAIARSGMIRQGGGVARASAGAPLDGSTVRLQQVRPDAVDLSVYYDPLDLEPVERGGNQVVLVSFADAVGDGLGLLPATQGWRVSATRSSGENVADVAHASTAVELSDLVALAGDAVEGSAGRLSLVAQGETAANRLAFFVASLGTFATGYLLPPVGTTAEDGDTTGAVLATPASRGDQAIFYYDTRDGYTTFLNLANQGDDPLEIELVLYGAALDAPFRTTLELGARSSRTVDASALRADGLPARAGLAFATALGGDGRPVASHALAGLFTVANLATQSAWGAPALARGAIRSSGGSVVFADQGAAIDGTTVRLQRIAATRHDVAVYYDPSTLEPASLGGNQVLLASFADGFEGGFAAEPVTTAWSFGATRSNGAAVASGTRDVTGVTVTHLEDLAGAGVSGAAGRLRLEAAEVAGASGFALFTESLGTFATGYRLPALPR